MKASLLDPRVLLRLPSCYRMLQSIGARGRTVFVEQYLKPQPGQRLLDIGCGPADIVDFLPPMDYFGFDASQAYIDAATAKFGDRGKFICKLVTEATLPDPGTYDLVTAYGVVHHLDDDEARTMFRLAAHALKPGGRLVTIDACLDAAQSFAARRLVKMDRGRFVRTKEQYAALAGECFPHVTATVRHDLMWPMPWTHCVLSAAQNGDAE